MTRAQAIARLERKHGKRAYWHVGAKRSDPDQREAALTEAREYIAERDRLDAQYSAELAAFNARPEIKALRDAKAAASKLAQMAGARAQYRKFTVGYFHTIGGLEFAHIDGEGDTWEEAFEKAKY